MARANAKVRGVFQRDGIYWIRWACPHGHLHREKVGPKGLARQEYEKRKVRARTEGYCPRRVVAPKAVLVSEAVKDFLAYAEANKRSHADDRRRATRITADFGNRLLDDITPKDVEDWKSRLAEEGKPDERREPTTVNRYLALFKTVYSMAVRNRKANDNPVKGVRLFPENNARVRYLTDDEETALMAVLPDELRPMVRFAILTGLRRGELFGLQWERVDFRSRTLSIPRSKHGKARSAPLGSEAETILRRLPRRLGSPWVFPQPGELGEPYRDTPKAWDAARDKAGLADFRWHDLRHTFGSRLAMATVDILTIKELMGHKTLAMTLRYAHLSPSHVGRAVDVLSRRATDTATGTNSNGPRYVAEGRA